jgi:hypothetical protein
VLSPISGGGEWKVEGEELQRRGGNLAPSVHGHTDHAGALAG